MATEEDPSDRERDGEEGHEGDGKEEGREGVEGKEGRELLHFPQALARGLYYRVVRCPRCQGWTAVKTHAKRKNCPRCRTSFKVPEPLAARFHAKNSLKASEMVRKLQQQFQVGRAARGFLAASPRGSGAASRAGVGQKNPELVDEIVRTALRRIQEVNSVSRAVGVPLSVALRKVQRATGVDGVLVSKSFARLEASGQLTRPTPASVYLE